MGSAVPSLHPVFASLLEVSIERRVEMVEIVVVPLHSLGNIVRAPGIYLAIARSSVLIAADIDIPGNHIIVSGVRVVGGDLEGQVRGVRVVRHAAFFYSSENLKIAI